MVLAASQAAAEGVFAEDTWHLPGTDIVCLNEMGTGETCWGRQAVGKEGGRQAVGKEGWYEGTVRSRDGAVVCTRAKFVGSMLITCDRHRQMSCLFDFQGTPVARSKATNCPSFVIRPTHAGLQARNCMHAVTLGYFVFCCASRRHEAMQTLRHGDTSCRRQRGACQRGACPWGLWCDIACVVVVRSSFESWA